jgi:surface antigen
MNVGMPWGHVGVVTEVGKEHITIEEANFKNCKITKRHDTSANLMIIGYFNPQY